MQTVILAGGKAEGLFPFSATRPTCLIEVGGRPVLSATFYHLRRCGVRQVLLVVGHKREVLSEHYGRGDQVGLELGYAVQREVTGIGEALLTARPHVSAQEPFLLIYGDIRTPANIFAQALEAFSAFEMPVAVVCLTRGGERLGNVYMDESGRITRVIEKPGEPGMGNYVLAGVYVLPPAIFDLIEKSGGKMEEALAELIQQVGLRAVIWEEDWVDLEYPWKILEANTVVMDRWRQARIDHSVRFHGNVKVEGPVRIERDVVVDSGSVIKGPCFIGAGTYIGNNALVRHYTAIGPGAVVGYGVELKNCVVFSRSMIGRLSFIGDSVVGENVDIGSGTMTVNVDLQERTIQVPVGGRAMDTGLRKLGAFIGDGARIGASNTLAAGSIIAPGAIVPHHFTCGGGD